MEYCISKFQKIKFCDIEQCQYFSCMVLHVSHHQSLQEFHLLLCDKHFEEEKLKFKECGAIINEQHTMYKYCDLCVHDIHLKWAEDFYFEDKNVSALIEDK